MPGSPSCSSTSPGGWRPSSAEAADASRAQPVAGSALVVAGAGRYLWVGLHPGGAVVSAGSRF